MEDRIVEYKGKGFMSMVNKYFMYNDNKNRSLTFKEIDPRGLFLKINTYKGKKLYSFSAKYNSMIDNKFHINSDKEYYVYYDDIDTFNELTKNEQLDYLSKIDINNLKINDMTKQEIQKILRPYIKTEIKYSGTVKVSSEMSSIFWWHIDGDFNDMTLDILVNSMSSYSFKTIAEVNYGPPKEKKKYETFGDKISDFLNNELVGSGQFILHDTSWDARRFNYSRKIVIKAKNIINDEGNTERIGAIYIYPIYNKYYARVGVAKDLADNYHIEIKYGANIYDGSIETVKERLKVIGEGLQKDEKYEQIAKVLLNL